MKKISLIVSVISLVAVIVLLGIVINDKVQEKKQDNLECHIIDLVSQKITIEDKSYASASLWYENEHWQTYIFSYKEPSNTQYVFTVQYYSNSDSVVLGYKIWG